MFLAAYYWGFSFIEVQGPHKRCKGLWCVQGPHLLSIYLYILRIINMIWCKGLNERCKGLNEWCKGHNEWCKGLWCVQGPHNMPFYRITNDYQYGVSIHCSLAPCYFWERGKRAIARRQWIYFHFLCVFCLQFWCNKNFPNAPRNPIAALNLERLLSARQRYITAAFQILKTDSSLDIYA